MENNKSDVNKNNAFDKIDYRFGFSFSDPLASIVHVNYLNLYKDSIEFDNIYTILDRSFSIRSLDVNDLIKNIIEPFADTKVFFDADDYIFMKDGKIYKMDFTTRKEYIDLTVTVYTHSYNDAVQKMDNLSIYLDQYKINIASFKVEWKYKGGSYNTTEYVDDEIHGEAYPIIKDIEKFTRDYINSDESVLILRGLTGTGKTRLIRYILRELSKSEDKFRKPSVLYTMDDNLLADDGFFVSFLNSNYDALVLEDLDNFLKSRKEGNNTMSKLLTVSDGVVQSMDKKIIISTNLNTVGEFDEALLRSGRCFANVRFRKLKWDESVDLIKKINPDFDYSDVHEKEYSVAEIYEIVKQKKVDAETNDEGGHFTPQIGFSK